MTLAEGDLEAGASTDAVLAGALDEEATIDLAADEQAERRRSYEELVRRLSRQSVEKHFNPFVDIAWDDPANAIDPTDPRWIGGVEAFGDTDWYRSLDEGTRARMGLYRIAAAMKTGLEFENVLKRGLLEYAFKLPNGAAEFRYVYHEVIEESYHGLMFQEFVNRSGFDITGMPWAIRLASRQVVTLARTFPELFFLFVLGGEDPIDHQQRKILRNETPHPLLERIMRIHVTEEARHLSFARHHLKQRVPALGRARRFALSIAAPILLGIMARQMLLPPSGLVKHFGMPPELAREVARSRDARREVRDSLAKVRRLCVDLGLVTPLAKRLWIAAGLWDRRADADRSPAPAAA